MERAGEEGQGCPRVKLRSKIRLRRSAHLTWCQICMILGQTASNVSCRSFVTLGLFGAKDYLLGSKAF